MGHSSINVSLTYLRGLEIPDLKEEDMPVSLVNYFLFTSSKRFPITVQTIPIIAIGLSILL